MEETKKTGTVPFVLSLLSVICLFLPAVGTVAALVLGIIALVLTVNARKVAPGSLLTAAFVLSIIGIAAAGVELLFVLTCIGFASSVAGGVFGAAADALRYF